ncbi:alpha/beta hydrolase [Halioxenophilus sp. WMMB6]|uniref:alpha/beta hydrolase n=1 Tax=Halioxenophilus sp. WMMB6 TaxID=3073815 RepID=UPI00295EE7C1|nr:alpha/beta hydrolase [Halioxenophilus sp. WMMB6]
MNRTLLPAALINLLAALIVSAQASALTTNEQRLQPQWQQLDGNGDGHVSLTELHPLQARAMQLSDNNHDGEISLSEYVEYNDDPGGAANIPLPENVTVQLDLPYAGSDDPRQRVDLYLPKKPAVDGPLPVVFYLHGGGWLMGSKIMARSQVLNLVHSGRFAAVSAGYRLSWAASWPAQIHDVKAAVRWLRGNAGHYGLDGNRICAMGASAGGHLAALLGTTAGDAALEGDLGDYPKESSAVQCVIDFFGPADLAAVVSQGQVSLSKPVFDLLGESDPEQRLAKARQASPLFYVSRQSAPFMILHGTRDPLVAYSDSVALREALQVAEVPVIFQSIENGGHGDFASVVDEVNRRVAAFLEQQFYDPATLVAAQVMVHQLQP